MKQKQLLLLAVLLTAFTLGFLMKKENKEDAPATDPLADFVETERYQEYSEEKFDAALGKRRVLFFYAAWCPTCGPADRQFKADVNQIPEDVVLFRVDYDKEKELKAKYEITYQHTFVQVDESGNEVAKWNGGSFDGLLANLK